MNIEERLEKYGVADENGELVIDKVREKKDIIDSGVRLLHEIETLKEEISYLVDESYDKGYDKKEIKALIKYAHKNSIGDEIEKLEEIQAELNNMFKNGEE